MRSVLGLCAAALLFGLPDAPSVDTGPLAPVSAVRTVGMTVADMPRAYAALRAHGVTHASTGPQRLPD